MLLVCMLCMHCLLCVSCMPLAIWCQVGGPYATPDQLAALVANLSTDTMLWLSPVDKGAPEEPNSLLWLSQAEALGPREAGGQKKDASDPEA